MESIENHHCIGLLIHLSEVFDAQKEYLTLLDSEIGDGDLGVTMTLGFRAIRENTSNWSLLTISEILHQCGNIFSNVAPSTIGTLLATGFLRASQAVRNVNDINPTVILDMLEAATLGIMSRGKATLGDKTMLDALIPALEEGKKEQKNPGVNEYLANIAEAAQRGAEGTKNLQSKMGRARWLQERTIGHFDPGAITVAIILRETSAYINKIDNNPSL